MIKFVMYSLPGKIVFSTLFSRNSSAFDEAIVSLECQSGQVYWRSGPGHITVQKQTITWAGERTKIRISRPQNENFSGTAPSLDSTSNAEGDTPSHTPSSYTLGACGTSILAPSALDLAPPNPNPGSCPISDPTTRTPICRSVCPVCVCN